MPIDPSTVLASLSAAFTTAKAFANTPLKAEYIALMELLQTAREDAFAVQEELHAARSTIRELEQAAKLRSSLTIDRGVYWSGDSREFGPDGPYCTRCFDVDGKAVRLGPEGTVYARCKHRDCRAVYAVWPERFSPPANQGHRRGSSWVDGIR